MALTNQVQQLGEAANLAKTAWNETKSRAMTARTVGLITPTDVAQVNSRPDGIGKRYIALAGLFGGLLVGVGLILLIDTPTDTKPNDNQGGSNASVQSTNRPTVSSQVPQHRTSTLAANSASAGAFEHAASAMQSAAEAMRLAATSETTEQSSVPSPSQATPVQNQAPRPVPRQEAAPAKPSASQTPAQPATNSPKPADADAMRMALQNQSSTVPPKDARAQPVAGQAGNTQTKKKQRTSPKTDTPSSTNPFLTKKPGTSPKTAPANVRPVDLAKSASVENEFVRVNTPTGEKSKTESGKPVATQPQQQRAKIDSSVQNQHGQLLIPFQPLRPLANPNATLLTR